MRPLETLKNRDRATNKLAHAACSSHLCCYYALTVNTEVTLAFLGPAVSHTDHSKSLDAFIFSSGIRLTLKHDLFR